VTKAAAYHRFDRVCTIFSLDAKDAIRAYLEAHAAPCRVEFSGRGKVWSAATVRGPKDSDPVLTLNRLQFVGPGNKGPAAEFNQINMGTGNFFKDVRVKSKETRQKVLDQIYNSEVIVGCVGEPELSKELGHYRLLFGIAGVSRGMIFDGQGMLDPHGKLVLDKFGHTDIQVFEPEEANP